MPIDVQTTPITSKTSSSTEEASVNLPATDQKLNQQSIIKQERARGVELYIAIGASAGGVEAIERLICTIPNDSGCAWIIVQHLSPDHRSMMVELLSRRTAMPVVWASADCLVQADHIYISPANYDLSIINGRLQLALRRRDVELNMPIDRFFCSLAKDQRERVIALVLSGSGSDGARGIRAVKEHLGIVLVQESATAAFDGMPRAALATGLVDAVIAPEEFAGWLCGYLEQPSAHSHGNGTIAGMNEEVLARIYNLLRPLSGIDFSLYKPSTVLRRIERRMSANLINSPQIYIRLLEERESERELLQGDLLIGVTYFFRDRELFNELEQKFIPELLADSPTKQLRIWVVACSSGEEAYSLAILCRELMRRQDNPPVVKIFATDVDVEAVKRAGNGFYPESVAADIPDELLNRWFVRSEDGYQVARELREMVVFARHNVISDPPFTNIDLISCRNMLIYMKGELQRRILELLNFSLRPDGILLLGASESVGDMSDRFKILSHKWKLYRSQGHARNTRASTTISSRNAAETKSPSSIPQLIPVMQRNDGYQLIERLLQGLAGRQLPFTMVVNERRQLLYVVGENEVYLRFPTGRVDMDVLHLIHPDLTLSITSGVEKIISGKEHEMAFNKITIALGNGEVELVDMDIIKLPQRRGQLPLITIIIKQTPYNITKEQDIYYDYNLAASQRINELEQALHFSSENLQATIEELETSNEELQTTNEELLASNEELQSTNEELQSVNEELYTVNAEYQGKILELTEVNNDLDNLLANTRIATLFLDEQLEIRRFTSEVCRFIRILEQDIGRPLSHFVHELEGIDLVELSAKVNHNHHTIEQMVRVHSGEHYLMRIHPYRIGHNSYAGVLLTFVSIDSDKCSE